MKKSSALILLVTLLGTGWLVSRNNTAAPPGDGSAVAPGAAMVAVTMPEPSAETAAGAALYAANCAVCHGKDAGGQQGVAPPLVHKIYRNRSHADFSFVMAVQNGVRSHHWSFGNMPKIEGVSQEDAMQIAGYIRSLQKANGIE